MCSGPKRESTLSGCIMEGEAPKHEGPSSKFSPLLELAASNDLVGFKRAVEEEGCDIDGPGLWYGRRIGSKKMSFEQRTPLLIAAMFGSKDVFSYIVGSGRVDVNVAYGSDGATALHCAAAGGSAGSVEVVKVLLNASADINSLDANGNRAFDLIAPSYGFAFTSRKKMLEMLLNRSGTISAIDSLPDEVCSGVEAYEQIETMTRRKEYPVDVTLPDIKNGIYGTDEFRMYTFKVKPCSRAYSHDWTECPFVHPGENARRRDPRKFLYSCVPCPEFRKGSCRQGDNCEYAHGIFECWLHPAQYRTRLCKDEMNCNRRVCFFAHKAEELRPLYASTGSAVPSPRSYSEMGSVSPLALPSPPLTPPGGSSSMGGSTWHNQLNILPPTLQLPGSRLQNALSARDVVHDMELPGMGNLRRRRQQQLIDELRSLSSPSSWKHSSAAPFYPSNAERTGDLNWLEGVNPNTNLDDFLGSRDTPVLSSVPGFSLDAAAAPQLPSPTGMMFRSSYPASLPPSPGRASSSYGIDPSGDAAAPQLPSSTGMMFRSSYPASLPPSPGRAASSYGIDPSGAAAPAVLPSRSTAFAKRSQSFKDRTAANWQSGIPSLASSSATSTHSNLTDWGSPDGKLDWSVHGDELNKLRKSSSSGLQSNVASMPQNPDEPDVSWVQSLVKDTPQPEHLSFEEQQQQCYLNSGGSAMPSGWMEHMYLDQEQMVA